MLIADTHVHIYPSYDAAAALECAYKKLRFFGRSDTPCHIGLFLTERYDCFFYRDLTSGRVPPPAGFSLTRTEEDGAVMLENVSRNVRLYLFAGRQIVTADGIEVLALTIDADIADGQSTGDTLAKIRQADGIPVLSWAPGKWLGRRGNVIRALIEQAGGEPLALGDTCMRPIGYPMPCLIRHGIAKGLPVLAGTDPLPFAGDENIMGTFGICGHDFDDRSPVRSVRAMIQNRAFTVVGRRNSPPAMIKRWLNNQQVRKSKT